MIRNVLPLLLVLLLMPTAGMAKRLKVLSFTKTLAPGQLAFISFENPDYEKPYIQAKCNAEKLIAWVKSDIPILRIEQNGKQIWTALGSYMSAGDSCVATFMTPQILVPGAATLFLVNGRDASIPYKFTVVEDYKSELFRLQGAALTPLAQFKLIGNGFMPTEILDQTAAITELENNVSYAKLDKADQFTRLNKRMANDWDRVEQGNFLFVKQGDKEWRLFVDQCSITPQGMSLDFTAPPGLTPGTATLTLALRNKGKEVARTAPMEVRVL